LDRYLFAINNRAVLHKNGDGDGNTGGNSVAVTCKTGVNMYKKHYVTLNGNVSYFSEQLGDAQVVFIDIRWYLNRSLLFLLMYNWKSKPLNVELSGRPLLASPA